MRAAVIIALLGLALVSALLMCLLIRYGPCGFQQCQGLQLTSQPFARLLACMALVRCGFPAPRLDRSSAPHSLPFLTSHSHSYFHVRRLPVPLRARARRPPLPAAATLMRLRLTMHTPMAAATATRSPRRTTCLRSSARASRSSRWVPSFFWWGALPRWRH